MSQNKKATLIALTGGPCAYKSGMLLFLTEELTQKGVHVITMPEAATLCIMGGIHPMHDHVGVSTGQRAIMRTCRALQNIWTEAANSLITDRPVVVIMDRGVADSMAYTPEGMYHELLAELGTNHGEILHEMDCVIHLVTAAEGALQFYSLNNPARYETAEQAIATDHRTREVWNGTPHYSLIDNSGTLEDKKARTLDVVLNAIGLPAHVEKEAKILVRLLGKKVPVYHTSFLLDQFYCYSSPGTEVRVRKRTMPQFGFAVCIYGQKRPTDDGEGRYEIETYMPLSFWDSALASMKDPLYNTVSKERTTFLLDGVDGAKHYAELDRFLSLELPWEDGKDLRLLEVEYTGTRPEIVLPPWLELIADVTNKGAFKNRSLAASDVG